jgi:adenylate kinase
LKVVVLFGPPGAGKGTQSGLLASRLGAHHVSTGGLLRAQIASGSPLGHRIKSIVESGRLVDDSTLFEALEAELASLPMEPEGVLVLDGVPRTESQVERLDSSLALKNLKVDVVLYVSAPVQKLVERFARRWACRACGAVFSLENAEVAASTACSSCDATGSLFRRVDDAPETVERRFRIYEEETLPVVEKYRVRNLVKEIDGLQSPERVYVQVVGHVVPK